MAQIIRKFNFYISMTTTQLIWAHQLYDRLKMLEDGAPNALVSVGNQTKMATIAEDLWKSFSSPGSLGFVILCTERQEFRIRYHGSGNPKNAALFVQAVFKHFNIPLPVIFYWANICESPEVYGGGACIATADTIQIMDVSDWAQQKWNDMQKTTKEDQNG